MPLGYYRVMDTYENQDRKTNRRFRFGKTGTGAEGVTSFSLSYVEQYHPVCEMNAILFN